MKRRTDAALPQSSSLWKSRPQAKDRIIPTLERLKREQANPHPHLVHGLTDAINMLEELCYRLESRSAK
jgi:hypothetical protein